MEGFPKPRAEKEREPALAHEGSVNAEEIVPILNGLQEKLDESRTQTVDEYELPPEKAAELNSVLKNIKQG